MAKPIIILADKDENYLIPLELKFIQEFGDGIDLRVITEEDYLHKYFDEPQKADILIINENISGEWIEKHNINSVFILTDTNVINNQAHQKYTIIYKYTSIKEVFNDIISNPKSKAVFQMTAKNKSNILMVYSPVGGTGKTVTALGISAALSKAHKNVLYLSTEILQAYSSSLNAIQYASDIFASSIKNKSPQLIEMLEKNIGTNGFTYILPFEQSTTALNLSLNDYIYLIESIKNSNVYDFIVVDTSNDLTIEKSRLMSFCDKVIIITLQTKTSVSKLECLINNIDCSDKNRFLFVCNQYDPDKQDFIESNTIVSKQDFIEYIPYINFNEYITIEDLLKIKPLHSLAYRLI